MNKIALITGCNRGIGRACLELFAQNGISVVACVRTKTDELLHWYSSLERLYDVKIYSLFFDLADDDAIKAAMKELYSWKLQIDILVNNAGIASGGFMLMTSMAKMKEVFQINYFSQVLLTQSILKMMIRNKKGNILFMSSVLGLDARPGATSYGASKAAIALLTKSLSKEVAAYGIRVNALAPNLVDTEMAHLMEEKSYLNMIDTSSLKRLATPKEVANVALFLVSDESSYITGQVIRVDGGL